MMTYDKISKEVEDLFRTLQGIIIAALVYFGSFVVAAVPAVFTGMGVAALFIPVTNHYNLIGWLVGVALEVVNIIIIHTASEFYSDKPTGRFWILIGLMPVYVFGVEWVMYYSDGAFPELVRSLGMVSPFFAIAVFIAVMFNQWHKATQAKAEQIAEDEAQRIMELETQERQRQIEIETQERQRQVEIEAQDRAWQQERERLEMEQRHAEKLARIEAKKGEKAERKNSPQIRLSKEQKRQIALNILRENPQISGAQLGQQLGASDRTGQTLLRNLERDGAIHRNGEGWKVN